MSQRMPPYKSGFQNHSGRPCAAAGVAMSLDDLVGSDIDGLDHLADGPGLDQFARFDGGLYFQPLAEHDAEDTMCVADGFAHLGKLLERGDPGLSLR